MMRSRTFQSIFRLNVGQTLQNLADWAGVQAVVPQKYAMAAALKIARDIPGERAWILERSPEMRLRADGVGQLSDQLRSVFKKSEIGRLWDQLGDVMMIPFETTQAMVEFPVWRGSFDHALAQGKAEGEALRHADDMVRRMFGGRRTIDLSPAQRSQILRHLTMFWGWSAAQLNLWIRAKSQAGQAWAGGGWKMKAQALRILGVSFASLSAKMLASELFTGKGPKDEDGDDSVDAGDVARWAAFRSVMTIPSTIPILGSGFRTLAGEEPSRDLSLTPWLTMANAAFKALSTTQQAVTAPDELTQEQEIALFVAWMEAGGSMVGAPVTQARATTRYWMNRPDEANLATDILGTAFGRDKPGKLSHLTLDE